MEKKSLRINSNGAWGGLTRENMMNYHSHDDPLCQSIISFLNNENAKTVADLGCGAGFYTDKLNSNGIQCFGYDGNLDTYEITKGTCSVLALEQPFRFPELFDWILSLEVGEHIPREYESNFIDNLCSNSSKGIILSWAVENQGGDGHVNCRNNDYIQSLLEAQGYSRDLNSEDKLRNAATRSWFKNTIMVFRKS